MATAAAMGTRYATGAVYGSEAYDLRRVPGYYEEIPQGETKVLPSPEELARERLERRARERAQERARAQEEKRAQAFGLPVLGLIGGVAAAAMLVLMLLGFVQLAALSGQTNAVRAEIAALQEENEAIKVRYETTFDMDEIEMYAVNILGMVKGDTEDQVIYTSALGDRAQVLSKDETSGLLARLSAFFKDISEYFG